jgi:hypothetical protein
MEDFLTVEESTAVDQALMTSREKFSTRVAVYSLRLLKQLAAAEGVSIEQMTPEQITAGLAKDSSIQSQAEKNPSFLNFFQQLVLSSLKPLTQVARSQNRAIAELTVADLITWFEQEAKQRIEREKSGSNPST